MATQGIGKKSASALGAWAIDKAIEKWPVILAFFVSGGGMAYLASISKWLEPYGPVAWGGVGVLTVLLLVGFFWVYAIARAKLAYATYTSMKAESGKINTLEPIHKREQINLSDMHHPFYRPIKNARFEECEFFGPGNVMLMSGCSFDGVGFGSCEFVIVRTGHPIVGVVAAFESCVFLKCELYLVTILMSGNDWKALPEEMRKKVPVISEAPPP